MIFEYQFFVRDSARMFEWRRVDFILWFLNCFGCGGGGVGIQVWG
jgi:hypothetical protein